MAIGIYHFNVSAAHDGKTVKTFLRRVCGISARSMTLLKYAEIGILRNDMPLRAHDILHAGDMLLLKLPPDTNDIHPAAGAPDILYEDERLLVVNKSAAMSVHPTKVHQLDTLANIISYYQQSRGESYTFRALNRLDKDTSGCVMIAKDRIAYALVQPTIHKTYLAICEGCVLSEGVVNAPIGLADGSVIRRCVRPDGAEAITHYRPVGYVGEHTIAELWLETGRTHQIRCHMSSIGHPLAGDDLYGGHLTYLRRQALHCRTVTFTHPDTHEVITLEAPIPKDIQQITVSS